MVSVIRKVHLYSALFLTPWILMYGTSGFLMNHREYVQQLYNGRMSEYVKERHNTYNGVFPENAGTRVKAEQILTDMNLIGSFNANENAKTGILSINRLDPIKPRRLTFNPSDRSLIIEREMLRFPTFMQRLHLRRGFQHEPITDDVWALMVDSVIAAIFFWCISGVIMWRTVKIIHRSGVIVLLTGMTLFLFLVLTI